MVKYEVSINIPSKNNFLVTNIFPLIGYAVCTTYAGIPDSSQCSAGWNNFWRNTLLGKFSLSKYLWNLRTDSGQLYWTSTDCSLFNLQKITCIGKSVSKSKGVKSDDQSMKMEEISFQNAPPERILFHFAVLFFVHHWCPAHDEEALYDCHHGLRTPG